MRLPEIILKPLLVIVTGIVIFWVDSARLWSHDFTKIIILVLALFKTCYFIAENYFKIKNADKNSLYYKFLIFMGFNIGLLIISFAIDFFILNEALPESFMGVNDTTRLVRFCDFLYFSSLNMTNFGFGTLMPLSVSAKALTTLEVILSFTVIIFVLSDFMSLRESIRKRGEN